MIRSWSREVSPSPCGDAIAGAKILRNDLLTLNIGYLVKYIGLILALRGIQGVIDQVAK